MHGCGVGVWCGVVDGVVWGMVWCGVWCGVGYGVVTPLSLMEGHDVTPNINMIAQ